MPTVEAISLAVRDVLAVAKSVDARAARKLSTVLAADQKKLHAALAVIGTEDVPLLITSGGKGGTSAPNVPGAATDLLAPTKPAYPRSTPAVGQITWAVEQSDDHHDGVTAGSGIASANGYDYRLNGGAWVPLARINANVRTTPAVVNIGSMSPAPTLTQNTNNGWTLVCAGTGLEGTANQIAFMPRVQVTGDFAISVSNVSLAPAASGADREYGQFGLIVMNAQTAGSPFVSISQFVGNGTPNSGNTRGVQAKKRTTTSGGISNFANSTGNDGFKDLILRRSGATIELGFTDNTGTWQQLVSEDASYLTSQVWIGEMGFSLIPTVTATYQYKEVCYSDGQKVSVVQTTTSDNQTIEWRARDVAGNVSASTTAITASPTVAPVGGSRNFNPGHYVWMDTVTSSPTIRANHFSQMVTYGADDSITGVLIGIYWGFVEHGENVYGYDKTCTTTSGNATIACSNTSGLVVGFAVTGTGIRFASNIVSIVTNTSVTLDKTCTGSGTNTITFGGDALIQQYADAGQLYGLKVHFRHYERKFGGLLPSDLDNGFYFPIYLKSAPYHGYTIPGGGAFLTVIVPCWQPEESGALCRLFEHWASRFGNNEWIESFTTEETSISFGGGSNGGYTDALYVTHWTAFINRNGAAFLGKKVGWRIEGNYFISDYNVFATLCALTETKQGCWGGPDTPSIAYGGRFDWADDAHMGVINGVNYRGTVGGAVKVARWCEHQDYDQKANLVDGAPYSASLNKLKLAWEEKKGNYVSWYNYSGSTVLFDTYTKPWLATFGATVGSTLRPLNYP